MLRTLRITKHRILLYLGYTLFNAKGKTIIQYTNDTYIVSGPNRFGAPEVRFKYCPYSMDDINWSIYR